MQFMEIGLTGQGLFPKTLKAYCTFTEAVAANDCVMLDMANTATGLATSPGGNEGSSIFNTVRLPDTVGLKCYWFGFAQTAVAAAGAGWVTLRGVTDLLATTVTNAGDYLVPAVAATTPSALVVGTGALDAKIVAIALADGDGTSGIAKCVVDGISGFGADVTT